MARGPSRRELFLQVGGTTDPLNTALKAGKSTLAEFGTSAENQLERVEEAFRKLAGANPAAAARELEQSYTRSFQAIREQAEKALTLPKTSVGAISIDAGAAREAATAATQQALALREIAVAADRAAAATNDDSAAARVYALAAAAAAQGAEEHAASLRAQAGVLENVQNELNATGATAVNTGKRINQATGQTRAGMQQLSFQLSDVATQWAANTPPSIIFAQQIGQVTQAIGLMTGEAKGFIGFLGGPWGLALSSALVVLTPFVAKLFEETEAQKEAKKASKEHQEAVEALEKSLKQAVLTTTDKLRADLQLIDSERKKAVAVRETTAALLEQAIARAQSLKQAALDQQRYGKGEGASIAAQIAQNDVGALQAQLAKNQAAVDRLTASTARATAVFIKGVVDANATPEGKIRFRYDQEARQAELEVERTKDFTKYRQTLQRLDEARETELKQLQEKNRKGSANANREFGRTVTSAEARAIAERAGFQVNSSDRTIAQQRRLYDQWVAAGRPADNPVAKPDANAPHVRGNALDIQIEPGTTVAAIKKAFADEGVRLTKIFEERGHYHVEFAAGPKGKTVDQDRAQTREADRQRAFVGQLDQYQDRYFRAQAALADGTQSRAELALQQLRADTVGYENSIDQQVIAKKLTPAEAEKLKILNQETYALSKTKILRDEQQRLLDRQLERTRQEIDGQISLLQLQANLATTQADRRRIALQILELERKQLLAAASRKIQSDDPETRDQGIRDKIQVKVEQADREEAARRANAGPLEQYRDRIRDAAKSTNEALEGVAANGLQSLEDGFVGIITGTETVASAFKKMALSIIADLARIAIEKAILAILPSGSIGFKDGGEVKGFADGGFITGAGGPRDDKIAAWLSNGEFVVNAAATRKHLPLLRAINDNATNDNALHFASGGLVAPAGYMPRIPDIRSVPPSSLARPGTNAGPLRVDARVRVDASPLLEATMEDISVRTVGAAAEPIMAGAEQRTLRRASRRVLPGGYG